MTPPDWPSDPPTPSGWKTWSTLRSLLQRRGVRARQTSAGRRACGNGKLTVTSIAQRYSATAISQIQAKIAPGYIREVVLISGFLIHAHYTMRKRRSNDPGAKPASAMADIRAVRQYHAAHHITMASSPSLSGVLKGLLALYVAAHGPESLIPHRKEPLTNEQTASILGIPDGEAIAGRSLSWSALFFVSFAAFLTTLRHGGFRKADLIPTSATNFNKPAADIVDAITRIPGFRGQVHDPGIARISTGP